MILVFHEPDPCKIMDELFWTNFVWTWQMYTRMGIATQNPATGIVLVSQHPFACQDKVQERVLHLECNQIWGLQLSRVIFGKSQGYLKAGSLTTPAHVGPAEILQQPSPSHWCIAGKCLRCWSAHFVVGTVGKVQTPPTNTAPALSVRTLTHNDSRSFASELPMACK